MMNPIPPACKAKKEPGAPGCFWGDRHESQESPIGDDVAVLSTQMRHVFVFVSLFAGFYLACFLLFGLGCLENPQNRPPSQKLRAGLLDSRKEHIR